MTNRPRRRRGVGSVEMHPDFEYLVNHGHLAVDEMQHMTDDEIRRYAAIERYEDLLDCEDR